MSEHVDVLNWVRPKAWKLDWELQRDGAVVGALSSPRLFGTGMSGTMGKEEYILTRGGLRRPGAAVRKLRSAEDLAVLAFDAIGKGTITFADGASYQLERQVPGGLWILTRPTSAMLFTVLRDTKSKYPSGRVEVAEEDVNLDVLLLLAWFVISTAEC